MSIIEEGHDKNVRMAHLAIVGSHAVNGVSALHSELIRTSLVPEFAQLWPAKFSNKTNGVAPRRWLLKANPHLSRLLCESIGDTWITDMAELRNLEPFSTDEGFQTRFAEVKLQNKQRLARIIRDETGVITDPRSMFDVQIKRIHEYKRQLLNVLRVMHDYLCIVEDGEAPRTPRTCAVCRQSRARILGRQADHQADPQRGRRGEQGPARQPACCASPSCPTTASRWPSPSSPPPTSASRSPPPAWRPAAPAT